MVNLSGVLEFNDRDVPPAPAPSAAPAAAFPLPAFVRFPLAALRAVVVCRRLGEGGGCGACRRFDLASPILSLSHSRASHPFRAPLAGLCAPRQCAARLPARA